VSDKIQVYGLSLADTRTAAAKRILALMGESAAQFQRVVFTRNRRVIASVGDRGKTLRVHISFGEAPEDVLIALGRLFGARSRAVRARARAVLRRYFDSVPTAPAQSRPPPRHRIPASDLPHLARLRAEFAEVNAAFFAGSLPRIPMRLSGRMKSRHGHFTSDPLEIVLNRALCERGAEGEAENTLRHEMIHLWQHMAGRKPGHGPDFRRWADRLGIHPRATREVCWTKRSR
jgi:predicted SprT family Zn-dependent metalloprotease